MRAHLPVLPVVVLVAERGGGGEEEGRHDHERDEGEAEEEEGVCGQLATVEDPDALAERESGTVARGAERVGGKGRHCTEYCTGAR